MAQYRAGKDKLFGFFVGQVTRASKGQADPEQVNELLKAKLADCSRESANLFSPATRPSL